MTTPQPIMRIALPSGGGWELVARPLWSHLRPLLLADARRSGDAGDGLLLERVLVALTTAWSFDEPICVDSLAARKSADVDAALEALCAEVLPGAAGGSVEDAAADLFRGLAAGRVPPAFVEVHLLALTGWSWTALQETPVDVVARMAEYLAVRGVKDSGGTLRLEEHDHDPR